MPGLVIGRLTQDEGGAEAQASAQFSALGAPGAQARASFFAQQSAGAVTATAQFSAFGTMPVPASAGMAIAYECRVTGLPGRVLSWEYSHNGDSEELLLTVAGQFGMDTPQATVQASALEAGGGTLGELPARRFQQLGQEPQVSVEADTTQFHFRNSFDQALRGRPLEELIPWKLNPSPESCGAVRQTKSISDLVVNVLRADVDPYFVLEHDPLAGATWIEGARDFSTLNLTPQALWDATYGALGMVLHVMPRDGGIRLVGRWPVPLGPSGGPALPESLVLVLNERREWLQTPTSMTVRGGDALTPLKPDTLLGWLPSDQQTIDEVAREVMPDMEWWAEQKSGTATTRSGYRKVNGQLVAEVEFTTDDVKVEEMVDGKKESRAFYSVLTGYTLTLTTYDPACPQRPLRQETTQKSWAYTPFTTTSTFLVTGPGVYTAAQAGDLSADTSTFTTYGYSPQGHQTSKVVSTTRLGSLQQDKAEEAPDKRGGLSVRELLRDSLTETWSAIGGGRWRHSVQQSVQSLMPVYDQETQEAVRTTVVTRNLPPVTEYTDQSPPSFACQPCPTPQLREVADPVGATVRAGDAGFAEPREVQLAFVDAALVGPLAQTLMGQQWGRVRSAVSLAAPLFFPPGTMLERGQVTSLRISQGEGEENIDTSLELVRRDDLWGVPGSAQDYELPRTSGRAVMLAGQPGGALARITTGWNVSQGKAKTEAGFIRFRTGFPPRPGDEIEWQLVNGQREATNAR